MIRRILLFVVAHAVALTVALGVGVPVASAHTECEEAYTRIAEGHYREFRFCQTHAEHYPNYKGWAAYADTHCGFEPFNAGMACTADFQYRAIWLYTAQGWQRDNLGEGTQFYVYPFSSTWRWGWTRDTGWFAIKASDVTLYWRTATGAPDMME